MNPPALQDLWLGRGLCALTRLLTGAKPLWMAPLAPEKQRLYFANHRSHGDFLSLWAALPLAMRLKTRPVAGDDYWGSTPTRRYLSERVLNSLLIPRKPSRQGPNPLDLMAQALSAGDSLILFPEGTRNLGDDLLPFKSGLYHIAKAFPELDLVPVWIENLGRVMPKGAFVPVPLLCTLSFGAPLPRLPDEPRDAFLTRSRQALLHLAPSA
jgi:1-acyl-sn-glycerol-3-phosphate acyltransferase